MQNVYCDYCIKPTEVTCDTYEYYINNFDFIFCNNKCMYDYASVNKNYEAPCDKCHKVFNMDYWYFSSDIYKGRLSLDVGRLCQECSFPFREMLSKTKYCDTSEFNKEWKIHIHNFNKRDEIWVKNCKYVIIDKKELESEKELNIKKELESEKELNIKEELESEKELDTREELDIKTDKYIIQEILGTLNNVNLNNIDLDKAGENIASQNLIDSLELMKKLLNKYKK